ncbi:MAG TPA: hypothetical protein ENN29_05375, partial [Candidatus Hydrogenedentes bacterium]|nr:hypothetical protein [Candidatus Hydrogenedentota bacterium]
MNTHITRSLTVCALIAVAVLSVAIISGQFTSDVFAVENNINMGAILDNLLWPKAMESIEPISQWTGRTIVTSDNNAFHPTALMPAYAHVTGTPDPADTIFYVMHPGVEPAFGSVTHENVTYYYWQHADGVYMG